MPLPGVAHHAPLPAPLCLGRETTNVETADVTFSWTFLKVSCEHDVIGDSYAYIEEHHVSHRPTGRRYS